MSGFSEEEQRSMWQAARSLSRWSGVARAASRTLMRFGATMRNVGGVLAGKVIQRRWLRAGWRHDLYRRKLVHPIGVEVDVDQVFQAEEGPDLYLKVHYARTSMANHSPFGCGV